MGERWGVQGRGGGQCVAFSITGSVAYLMFQEVLSRMIPSDLQAFKAELAGAWQATWRTPFLCRPHHQTDNTFEKNLLFGTALYFLEGQEPCRS